jgi:hypothetical protein
MIIEFSRHGKTYQCALAAPLDAPPARITVPFRPCVLKPPVELELNWLTTDEVRGIELYRPVREIRA